MKAKHRMFPAMAALPPTRGAAQALEAMLRSYQGAVIVVSHDDAFMHGLALTYRLRAADEGWRLEVW